MTRKASGVSPAVDIAAQTATPSVVAYETDRAITLARATSFGTGTRSTPAPSLQRSYTNESKFANHREWERAEPLYEKAYGREHRDRATVLNNLGRLYHAQDLYSKAEPFYQEALTIDTKVLPPNHAGIATDLNSLGVLYFAPTQWRKAEQMHLKVLEIRRKSLPSVHPEVATSPYNLDRLYEEQGHFAKAEPLFRQALDTFQHALPPDSLTPRKVTQKHAEIVWKLDKPARAISRRARAKSEAAASGRSQ